MALIDSVESVVLTDIAYSVIRDCIVSGEELGVSNRVDIEIGRGRGCLLEEEEV